MNITHRAMRSFSLLLALCLLLPLVTACGSEPKTPNGETQETGPTVDAPVDGEEPETEGGEEELGAHVESGLEKVDMGGKTFVFLSTNWYADGYGWDEIYAEEYTGEPINDGIYDRNLYMENNFNTSVEILTAHDVYTANPQFTQSVMSGDHAYNFFMTYLNQYQGLATTGVLYDLAMIPHVDYNRVYWDKNAYDALSIANLHFVVNSDITIRDKNSTAKMLFNKPMYQNLGLEDPYEMVREGRWTIDKLNEQMLLVSNDSNGDGMMDTADTYGLIGLRDCLCSFLNGCGYFLAEKNEEDIPVFDPGNEPMVTCILRIMDLMYDDAHFLNGHKYSENDGAGVLFKIFEEDRALYLCDTSGFIFHLREMDTDFGILPIPKKDEAQENYFSEVSPWVGACMALPVDTPDEELDWTGIFLEEYACQGRNYIIPSYYEKLLKGKNTRDADSVEMLDIIYGSRGYDIGGIGNWNDLTWGVLSLTMSNSDRVASIFKAKERVVAKTIGKLLDAIEDQYS